MCVCFNEKIFQKKGSNSLLQKNVLIFKKIFLFVFFLSYSFTILFFFPLIPAGLDEDNKGPCIIKSLSSSSSSTVNALFKFGGVDDTSNKRQKKQKKTKRS